MFSKVISAIQRKETIWFVPVITLPGNTIHSLRDSKHQRLFLTAAMNGLPQFWEQRVFFHQSPGYAMSCIVCAREKAVVHIIYGWKQNKIHAQRDKKGSTIHLLALEVSCRDTYVTNT